MEDELVSEILATLLWRHIFRMGGLKYITSVLNTTIKHLSTQLVLLLHILAILHTK